MKKETVKMLFVLAIAIANLVLVFTIISGASNLEQKRDFDSLVAGDGINVITELKDKVGSYRIVSNDRFAMEKEASSNKQKLVKPDITKKEVKKDKKLVDKIKKDHRDVPVKSVAVTKNTVDKGANNE